MKYWLFIIFTVIIIAIGIFVMTLHRRNMIEYRQQDVARNGQLITRLIEDYALVYNDKIYPETITQIFDNAPVGGSHRFYNPYTRYYVRIQDIDSNSFDPGYILYVVSERNSKEQPIAFKLYMLGHTSDPFYDKKKAMMWQAEYMEYTEKNVGPDNIVMVFGSHQNSR